MTLRSTRNSATFRPRLRLFVEIPHKAQTLFLLSLSSVRELASFCLQGGFDRIRDALGAEIASNAEAAWKAGKVTLCAASAYVYAWEAYGDELYITVAVGDFTGVYETLYAKARAEGFKSISANSMRGRAFERRLKALGYETERTRNVISGDYIKVKVS